MEAATGDLIAFTDADCIARPDWVDTLHRLHRSDTPVIGGDTTGALKPDPTPLRAALDALGVDASHAVMVGDSWRDVQVARAVVERDPRGVLDALIEAEQFGYDVRRFSLDLLDVFRDLGIAFVAYSPLGRGFLTGAIPNREALDANDWRRENPRFSDEALAENARFVELIRDIAAQKGLKECIGSVSRLSSGHLVSLITNRS